MPRRAGADIAFGALSFQELTPMTLKQQLAAVLADIEKLQASTKGREATDDETAALEALTAKGADLQVKIKSEQRRADASARASGLLVGAGVGGDGGLGGRKIPAVLSPTAPDGSISTRPALLDDPRRGYASLGEFGQDVWSHYTPGSSGPRPGTVEGDRFAIALAASGMSQGVPSDGGMTVPPQFSTDVWTGMAQAQDSLVGLCDVYPVEGESLTLLAIAETSRANGSRWGALRGYWKAEAAQMTATKIKLREVKIEPQELYVFCYVTDKLLRNNSGALQRLLQQGAQEEIAFLLNDAIMEGTGAGQPKGYRDAACTVTVSKEVGQAAATILKENVDNMWARCHARWRAGAVWLGNQDIEPALEKLATNVGTGGVPVFLPPGGVTEAPNARLKGRPFRAVEWASTLGTKGDLSLAALGAYLLGVRGTVETAMSMHLRFDYGETAFRWTFAADGQPWPSAALTPFKGANTLSPFVVLENR